MDIANIKNNTQEEKPCGGIFTLITADGLSNEEFGRLHSERAYYEIEYITTKSSFPVKKENTVKNLHNIYNKLGVDITNDEILNNLEKKKRSYEKQQFQEIACRITPVVILVALVFTTAILG